jgi:transposase
MNTGKDIILAVDYHAQKVEFRWFNQATGDERRGHYRTSRGAILGQVAQARREVAPGGHGVWVMESTTGWARVKDLLGESVEFVLANVLQMPLPPKARRRKTDQIDTGRILREYLHGSLPTSFQPSEWWRQVRRVVDSRQDLVERQTALKNWIVSLLHHETWQGWENLWSGQGQARLAGMPLAAGDRELVALKMEQRPPLSRQQEQVEARMQEVYDAWPQAQWVDQVRGIGMVTAVSGLAHLGPIERFKTAEDLISYAGLAPGVRQSDQTCYHGRIGGGGTDGHLRYLLIEASHHLSQTPRYRPAYERVLARRGKKVARIVVARLLLRSLYKRLRDRVRFHPLPGRAGSGAAPALAAAPGGDPR